jgi:methionyl-tRNA formyltransferase
MTGEPLGIVVICQEDTFVIPRNIEKVAQMPGVRLLGVVVLDVKGSVVNRKVQFAKGFGVLQTLCMGTALMWAAVLNLLDRCIGWRLLKRKRSIRAVAGKHRIPFQVQQDVHDSGFLGRLRELSPDLILSFSAPCVFKPEVLAIPRLGCINLHCSPLPRYAGLMPSFWAMYHGERDTGVTVHYMDDQIDNGAILAQAPVPISAGMSLLELIQRTKEAGGELVCEVLRRLQSGTLKPQANNRTEGTYFTWPTVREMRDFRAKGGRLI